MDIEQIVMEYDNIGGFGIGPPAQDTGDKILADRIRALIREKGRITFAEFMETALYDPERGYYTSGLEAVGTAGDYLTSPAMHPVFGAMVAGWLAVQWKEIGSPDPFQVVEMGAGKGFLCAGILAYSHDFLPEFYSCVRYHIIEKRRLRMAHCGPHTAGKVHLCESLENIPDGSVTGSFVSNELVDAFPVHLVMVEGGNLREVYIALDGERFVEETGEPSTPEIPAYFRRLNISLPEGYRTEVNLRAPGWIRQVGMKLRSGRILTIDYGYTAEEYYSPERRRGTLLCYYRHTWCEDPYARVGRQDITAHVDFTSLMEAGREAGLETVSLATQREFLLEQGIEEWLRQPLRPSDRRAIMALSNPRGMGKFRVLIQAKHQGGS